jgi:hypothetical protein
MTMRTPDRSARPEAAVSLASTVLKIVQELMINASIRDDLERSGRPLTVELNVAEIRARQERIQTEIGR